MNNLKLSLLIIILSFGFYNSVLSQWTDNDIWQIEFSRHGEKIDLEQLSQARKVNVDASGDYQLNLPLLKVPGRNALEFNINLAYSPGIKVTDQASWVGLGWELPIGSIRRIPIINMDQDIDFRTTTIYDEFRDQFSISCPAGSGTFVQIPITDNPNEQNFRFELEQWRDWKIIYDKQNERFIIITEDGTTYVFGMYMVGLTSSAMWDGTMYLNYFPCPTNRPFVEWKLTSVLGPDYIDAANDAYDPLDSSSPAIDNKGSWIAIIWDALEFSNDRKKWNYYTDLEPKPVLLNEITYPYRIVTPTHVAEFSLERETANISNMTGYAAWTNTDMSYSGLFYKDPDTNVGYLNKRLKNVVLYQYSGNGSDPSPTPIISAHLSYDDSKNRTTLQQVQIYEGDGTNPNSLYQKPYNFVYYNANTDFPANQVGGRYIPQYGYIWNPKSYGRVGYRGWYNGNPDYGTGNSGDSEFAGLPTDGKLWNLKTIMYPTGGSIDFEYESDHYLLLQSQGTSPDYWGNGIRLTKQIVKNGISDPVEYQYSYDCFYKNPDGSTGNPTNGIGVVYFSPLRYFTFRNISLSTQAARRITLERQMEERILYEKVTETNTNDGSKINYFFNVRKFNDIPKLNLSSEDPTEIKSLTLDFDGSVRKIEYVNSTNICTKEEEYSPVLNVKSSYKLFDGNGLHTYFITTFKFSETHTTTVFDENGNSPVSSTSLSYYNTNNGLPSTVVETNSDDTQRITTTKYPDDYTADINSTNDNIKAVALLKNKNMKTSFIERVVRSHKNSIEYVEEAQMMLYKTVPTGNIVLPQAKYDLKAPAHLSIFVDLSISNNTITKNPNYFLTETYDVYNDNNQQLQQTDANNTSLTTKWGYSSTLPIAKILNARNSETSILNFEDGTYGEWNTWTNGESSSSNHTGIKGWYLPGSSYGHITRQFQAIDLNISNKYTVSAWVKTSSVNPQLLWYIKLHNGSEIYTGNIHPSGTGEWEYIESTLDLSIYFGISFIQVYALNGDGTNNSDSWWDDLTFIPSDAQVTTNTYNPFTLKLTSMSDPNGYPKYVEYDGLQRLICIRNSNKQKLSEYNYNLVGSAINYTNPNSITARLYTDVNRFSSTIQYLDGLGRKIQTQTALDNDNIVSHVNYDSKGRLIKKYKPYQYLTYSNYDPDITTNDINTISTHASNYYNNTNVYGKTIINDFPYISTEYFDDDRIKSIKPEGSDWKSSSHYIRYSYGSNTSIVTDSPPNKLYKTNITDENDKVSVEYKDLFGNVVQRIDDSNGLNLITELNYDILGNLKKSTPPKGVDYASTYTYSTLSQLVQKHTPDAGTVSYLYDENGNLRFTQDANQAPSGKFTYNKYDSLNRLIETGEYTLSGGFTQATAYIDNFPESNKTINQELFYGKEYIADQNNLKGKISKNVTYRQGSIICTTFYSYDEPGRIVWLLHQIPGASDKKISYTYDLQDKLTKKCVTDMENNTLYTFYYYDAAGRLKEVYTNTIDSESGRVKEADYTYNADGTIKRLQLANAQGMDYQYNERGWLTQINHQNLDALYEGEPQDPGGDGHNGITQGDKFAEVIGYNQQGHIGGGTGFNWQAQYNGNISWSITHTAGIELPGVNAGVPDPIIGYVFNYDGANRLTKADFGYYHTTSEWSNTLPNATMYDLPNISYYGNGNINNLQRNGVDAALMDNFTYSYVSNTNKLSSITDAVTSQNYSYGYDNNGNLISDTFRGITNIVYNNRNLPEQLTSSGTSVSYWYDGAGNRIRKQYEDDDEIYVLGAGGETEAVFDAEGNAKFFNITTGAENLGRYEPLLDELKLMNIVLNKKYTGNKIIVGPNVTVTGTAELKAGTSITLKPGFTAVEGCSLYAHIDPTAVNLTRFYYLKDHLGSTRVTVNQDGSEIVSYDDYDPWGMQLDGRSGNLASAFDKFKFTGKERDVETGYDYFGARYYDSRIARWLQVDPLEGKYKSLSPYQYVGDNPIKYLDPDGEKIVLAGTAAQKQVILQHLQKLTNDKLAVKSDGTMIIVRMGGENSGSYYKAGNELIRELNQKEPGSNTVTISVGIAGSGNSASAVNWTDAQNGTGSDATVNFDPTSSPQIKTKDTKTGNVAGATRPNEIGLSHELIHAEHVNDGTVDLSTTTYTYQTASGSVTQTVKKEELRTVGLKNTKKKDVTENKIRKEHKLNERGAY